MRASSWTAVAVALSASVLASCAAPREGEAPYRPVPAAPGGPLPAPPRGSPAQDEPGVGERPLTLEECTAIALRRNRRVRIDELQVLVARERVDAALAGLLPHVTGDARYEVRNNDSGAIFGGSRVITAPRDVPWARLSVLVPIYDFGNVWNQRTAARLRAEGAERDAERDRQALALAVAEAYFTVLETERTVAVVDESRAVLERQLAQAKDFLSEGLVAPSDVLAAEVQLAARRQERLRAANNRDLAVAALNRVLGIPIANPTRVTDPGEPSPWNAGFDSVLGAALDRRADLASARLEIEAVQAEWRALRASFFPRFYAFGEAAYQKNEFLMNEAWASGGFGANLSILEGGATWAGMKAKSKEIDQAIGRHDDRVDDAVLDLQRAFLEARARAEEIPLARETVRLAGENLRAVRDRYSQGLATTTDVVVEEERLSRARAASLQALYGCHVARARLEFAAGGPLPSQ